MLDLALKFLTDELNSYLTARTGSVTAAVKSGRVVNEAGKYAIDLNHVGAALINVEEERILKNHLPEYRTVNGNHVLREPELKLNLFVLFSAHFTIYDLALEYLSLILTYFQAQSSFTPDEFPALDPRIGRLTLELQSLSFEQLNQIWAFIGGRHLPSVLYKVRLVVLQDRAPTGIQLPLTTIRADLRGR